LATYSRIIVSFEKSEHLGVGGRGVRQRFYGFDNYMIVTNDLSTGIELLRGGKVGRLSISEIAILHALDVQCRVETLVGLEVISILG